jgi:apolipoprotein N-acyltransferase
MHFRTLFDVASPPYSGWFFSSAGLLFVAGGIVAYFVSRERHGRQQAIGAGLIISSVGIGFTILTCGDVNAQHANLVAALAKGHVTTAEGRVTNYRRGSLLDHTSESWTVNGHTFVLNPAEVRVSFNETGVVQAGDSLRITLKGDAIVRLEKAEP